MIQVECDCGRVVKTKDQNAGRTVPCPECGESLTLPSPRRGSRRPARPSGPPGGLPSRRTKKKSASVAELEKQRDGRKKKKLQPKELDAAGQKSLDKATKIMFAISGVVGLAVVAGIGYWVFTGGSGSSASSNALPKKYVDFKSDRVEFTCLRPDGWEWTAGGGDGGDPPWAKFKRDESLRVEIRAAVSGTLIGSIAQSMSGENPDPLEPVRVAHNFRREQLSAGTDGYSEGSPEVVQTAGFGPSLMSTFEMTVYFSTDYGYRATVLGQQFQYNVTLFCEKDQVERFKPVIEKILQSLG